MTDDLVSDLRLNADWSHLDVCLYREAADRIEKDAAHIDEMYELVAAMTADHTASKTRIEKLEATLVKIGVWNNFEDRYQGHINELIHNALEGKDD